MTIVCQDIGKEGCRSEFGMAYDSVLWAETGVLGRMVFLSGIIQSLVHVFFFEREYRWFQICQYYFYGAGSPLKAGRKNR